MRCYRSVTVADHLPSGLPPVLRGMGGPDRVARRVAEPAPAGAGVVIGTGREAARHPLHIGCGLDRADEAMEEPRPHEVCPTRGNGGVDSAEGPGVRKPDDLVYELASLRRRRVETEIGADSLEFAGDRRAVTAEGTFPATAFDVRLAHNGLPFGGIGQEAYSRESTKIVGPRGTGGD